MLQGYDSIPKEIRDPKAKEVCLLITYEAIIIIIMLEPCTLDMLTCHQLPNDSFYFLLFSLTIGMKKRMAFGKHQRYQIQDTKGLGNPRYALKANKKTLKPDFF